MNLTAQHCSVCTFLDGLTRVVPQGSAEPLLGSRRWQFAACVPSIACSPSLAGIPHFSSAQALLPRQAVRDSLCHTRLVFANAAKPSLRPAVSVYNRTKRGDYTEKRPQKLATPAPFRPFKWRMDCEKTITTRALWPSRRTSRSSLRPENDRRGESLSGLCTSSSSNARRRTPRAPWPQC